MKTILTFPFGKMAAISIIDYLGIKDSAGVGRLLKVVARLGIK
jgi:hypothetical protein